MKRKISHIWDEGGFTLVEVLVVLVILAIMAAVSIPSMKGFIDDAKMKSHLTNARSAYVACQAAASELAIRTSNPDAEEVVTLAMELIGSELNGDDFTVELSGIKVIRITYFPKDSEAITITADGDVTYDK